MVNDVIYANPAKIIETWFPGDYLPSIEIDCDCYRQIGYHDCDGTSLQTRWDQVLYMARLDERYERIYAEILNNGFKVPIGAKLDFNNDIFLVDGHHRVAVALDLNLKEIPVFIGDIQKDVFDLRAVDSGYWRGSGLDSPWLY